MKTSQKILSLSLAATFVFGLSACSKDEPDSVAPSKPAATESAAPSPTAAPTSLDEVPTYKGSPELEEAQKAFPGIEDIEGATKEDIQLALYGAQRYTNGIYNSGYLANGSWVENGADSQELVKLFGKDWSDSYRAKLEGLINQYHNGKDEAAKNDAARDLMLHFFYFDNSGPLTIPPLCQGNNQGAASCLANGQIEDKDITYQVHESNGTIYVNKVFTANMQFEKDGVPGVSPVQYEIQLEMIKNPYPDEENLRFAYIVNDIGGSWKIDNWHEGE